MQQKNKNLTINQWCSQDADNPDQDQDSRLQDQDLSLKQDNKLLIHLFLGFYTMSLTATNNRKIL